MLAKQVASSFLIEVGNGDKFIFDMGTGSYINLIATGVPAAKLNKASSHPLCLPPALVISPEHKLDALKITHLFQNISLAQEYPAREATAVAQQNVLQCPSGLPVLDLCNFQHKVVEIVLNILQSSEE